MSGEILNQYSQVLSSLHIIGHCDVSLTKFEEKKEAFEN